MPANFTSGVMYGRRNFWHGEGLHDTTKEYGTATEALYDGNLDRKIEFVDIKQPYRYLDAEGHMQETELNSSVERFVVAQPNGRQFMHPDIVGVVGNKYEFIEPDELADYTDGLLHALGDPVIQSAVSLRDFRTIAFTAKTEGYNVAGLSSVDRYLVVSSTFDGTGAIRADQTDTVVECCNTLAAAYRNAKRTVTFKHTASAKDRMRAQVELAEEAAMYTAMMETVGNQLAEMEFSSEEFDEMNAILLKSSTKDKAVVPARTENNRAAQKGTWLRSTTIPEDLRFTRWGALMGVTEFDQWIRTGRTTDKDPFSQAFEKHIKGGHAQYSEQAFKILTEPIDMEDAGKRAARKAKLTLTNW